MEDSWFFTLPEIDNRREWAEDRPMDFSSAEDFSKVIVSPLGSAPVHLYLGLVIRKRNRSNSKLIVDSFLLPGGRGIFILKWWIEGDEGRFGIAAKPPDGPWRVCSEKEVPCWILRYDQKKKRMKGFGLEFRIMKKGEFN